MSKSYAEMKGQGSFNDATRGDSRAARMERDRAAGAKARAERDSAYAWVQEHLPESMNRWHSYAVDAVLRNDRQGMPRSVPAVKRTIARIWPYLPEWIKESNTKGDV